MLRLIRVCGRAADQGVDGGYHGRRKEVTRVQITGGRENALVTAAFRPRRGGTWGHASSGRPCPSARHATPSLLSSPHHHAHAQRTAQLGTGRSNKALHMAIAASL